jgi:hypothetical protein
MVFEKNDAGLVFAPPHLDMTNELVRRYNEAHKGEAKADGSKVPADAPVKTDPPQSGAPRKDQAPPPKK